MTGPQWDYRDAPPAPPAPFVPSLPRSTRPAQGFKPLPRRAGVPPWHPDYQLAAARGEMPKIETFDRHALTNELSRQWRALLWPLRREDTLEVVTSRTSAGKAAAFWGTLWCREFTVTSEGDVQTIKRVR